MKLKLLYLSILFLTLGCFEDDAQIIQPEDISGSTTAVPPGTVTVSATVTQLSQDNPYISIQFDAQIDPATIVYGTTVDVQYPAGTSLTEGTEYNATAASPVNTIVIDLSPYVPPISTTDTVRIVLTNGLHALANDSALTNPGNFDRVVQ